MFCFLRALVVKDCIINADFMLIDVNRTCYCCFLIESK
jgi:hypothetical protein